MDTLFIKLVGDSEKNGLYHSIIINESTTNNDILIAAIICATIVVLALFLLIYFCFVIEKRKEKGKEDKSTEKDKQFLDFCYEIARSKDKEGEALRKECWEILKKKFMVDTDNKCKLQKDE